MKPASKSATHPARRRRGNYKVSLGMYHIEKLASTLDRIFENEVKEQVAHQLGMSPKVWQNIRTTSSLSKASWEKLQNKLGQRFQAIHDICPEGWGGSLESVSPLVTTATEGHAFGNDDNRVSDSPVMGQLGKYSNLVLISTNAFTNSFRAFDERDKPVFIKTLSRVADATNPRSERAIKQLIVKSSAEFAHRSRLQHVKDIAHVIDYDIRFFPWSTYPVPFLVQEFIDGENLRKYLNSKHSKDGQFSGIPDARKWFEFARQLLGTLGEVHKAGVVHGDIWPDNIMMRGDTPVIVDFGESFLLKVHSLRTSDEVHSRSNTYMAPEKLESPGRWGRAADIYGVGGVLYFLATGEDPPKAERDNYSLKDAVFNTLGRKNAELLRQNAGIGDIILQCLHVREEDRAAHTDDILRMIDIFGNVGAQNSRLSESNITGTIQDILTDIKGVFETGDVVFSSILEHDLALFARRLKDIFAGHFLSITGDRKEILNGLLTYLSLLKQGDKYFTITLPSYWLPENFGIAGRFLRINKMLAIQGVCIRRLFLVTPEDYNLQHFTMIVRSQQQLMQELSSEMNTTDSSFEGDGFYTGIRVLSEAERHRIVKDRHHVGLAIRNGEATSLIFNAKESDKRVRRMEIKKEEDSDEIKRTMKTYFAESIPIQNFTLPSQ